MSSDILQDITDSIEDITELLESYENLFITIEQKHPDNIELAAIATILHSFYNGIEGIFLYIVKRIDRTVLNGLSWHQSLLLQMTEETDNRTPVISVHTADLLVPYLKFRHFFRHSYAFMLDWQRMKPLVDELHSIWATVKNEVESFIYTFSTEWTGDHTGSPLQ